MKNYNGDALKIQCKETHNKIHISWIGESDERHIDKELAPYFDELIDTLAGKEFVMRFDELFYMNSSTVPLIIRIIKTLNDKKIPTTILYDKNSTWQKASFKALETLSTMLDFISVQSI